MLLWFHDVIVSVHSSQDKGFHLDLDDFLHGLLFMATELVSVHTSLVPPPPPPPPSLSPLPIPPPVSCFSPSLPTPAPLLSLSPLCLNPTHCAYCVLYSTMPFNPPPSITLTLPPLCILQARLAVTSVTQGDYQRPFSISLFLAELSSGFRLLNLKNDSLRKKFDALKYDVKKVESVVYDITIRGLKPA